MQGTNMKSLFDSGVAAQVKQRFAQLRPDTARQWGKMTPAQAVAHCAVGLAHALGDERPSRMLLGHVFGGIAKKKVFSDGPMQRNTPTASTMKITDTRDLEKERAHINALIDRFATGPQACTDHPHTFFGKLSADEWGKLMYKHLDHHLQQFGV